MRFHDYLKQVAFAALALLIFGCKKEMKQDLTPTSLPNNVTTSSSCKPIGVGMYAPDNQLQLHWLNLMLKWYDGSGRLEYLKANMDWAWLYVPTVSFNLDYGQLTYENDMVYLKDVSLNKVIMKVKLDGSNRPLISWFDGLVRGIPWRDTTRFVYSPTGRLDSILVSYRSGDYAAASTIYLDLFCEYDSNGNLLHLTPATPTVQFRVNFKYDIYRPNPGISSHYIVTFPLKLLEYMELLQLPHVNFLQRVVVGAYLPGSMYEDETYPVSLYNHYLPRTLPSGQINYYQDVFGYPINHEFYTAWNCNGTTMFQTKNPSKEEFMRLIH